MVSTGPRRRRSSSECCERLGFEGAPLLYAIQCHSDLGPSRSTTTRERPDAKASARVSLLPLHRSHGRPPAPSTGSVDPPAHTELKLQSPGERPRPRALPHLRNSHPQRHPRRAFSRPRLPRPVRHPAVHFPRVHRRDVRLLVQPPSELPISSQTAHVDDLLVLVEPCRGGSPQYDPAIWRTCTRPWSTNVRGDQGVQPHLSALPRMYRSTTHPHQRPFPTLLTAYLANMWFTGGQFAVEWSKEQRAVAPELTPYGPRSRGDSVRASGRKGRRDSRRRDVALAQYVR